MQRITLTDGASSNSLPTGVCIQPHQLRSLPPRRTLAQAQVSGSKDHFSPAFSALGINSDPLIRVLHLLMAADDYNVGIPQGQGDVYIFQSPHASDLKRRKKTRRMLNISTLTLLAFFVFVADLLFLFF